MMNFIKFGKSTVNQGNLYDRVKKLLVSSEWSDCSFSVRGKTFKAHKLILGISSPVFEAMFYGPLSSDKDIVITDMEPYIFQLILNYMYTDVIEIISIEQAFELIYASKKYFLNNVTEQCIEYLQANLCLDIVIEVLNYQDFIHDEKLNSSSLKLFCEHANYLLEEYKSLITLTCMMSILKSDEMNISERDLIMHVFEWTTCFCEQNGLSTTVENKRELLHQNGIFDLLRFNILTFEELQTIYANENNILSLTDLEDIKKRIIFYKKFGKCTFFPVSSMPFPRKQLQLQWYVGHRMPIQPVAPMVLDANKYIIECRIKVNKSVFIKSICRPTRMKSILSLMDNGNDYYSEQLSITITSESDKDYIKRTNLRQKLEYESVVDINLDEPCLLKKDEWYKISFKWFNNRYDNYAFVVALRDKYLSYHSHNVIFEFDDLPLSVFTRGSFITGLKFCL